MWWAAVVACVALLAVGQVLFKLTAVNNEGGLVGLITSPYFLVAIVVYGFASLLWVGALHHLELSRAYLLMSLSFVIVPVLAYWVFSESLTPRFLLGSMLIVLGITIAMRS